MNAIQIANPHPCRTPVCFPLRTSVRRSIQSGPLCATPTQPASTCTSELRTEFSPHGMLFAELGSQTSKEVSHASGRSVSRHFVSRCVSCPVYRAHCRSARPKWCSVCTALNPSLRSLASAGPARAATRLRSSGTRRSVGIDGRRSNPPIWTRRFLLFSKDPHGLPVQAVKQSIQLESVEPQASSSGGMIAVALLIALADQIMQ